jgi:ribosomal protein S18 acetylase RimI-like enzyme
MRGNSLIVFEAGSKELRSLAEMTVAHSADPERHCLHSYSSGTIEDVYNDLETLRAGGEFRCVAAHRNGKLIGGLACEFDGDRRRVWLRGPYLEDWNDIPARDELWSHLLSSLPFREPQLDSFVNVQNKTAIRFYNSLGFRTVRPVHSYSALRPDPLPASDSACIALPKEHEAAYCELHKVCFPGSQPGSACLEERNENLAILALVENDRFLGYIHVAAEQHPPEGYVEFLGVLPDARRQGVGRTLLAAGLNWCFVEKEMPQVGLTVNEELNGAQSLYESMGFVLQSTGLHQQLDLSRSPTL